MFLMKNIEMSMCSDLHGVSGLNHLFATCSMIYVVCTLQEGSMLARLSLMSSILLIVSNERGWGGGLGYKPCCASFQVAQCLSYFC